MVVVERNERKRFNELKEEEEEEESYIFGNKKVKKLKTFIFV
jgi:hypothetical protein